MADLQMKNNTYASDWATKALSAGDATAKRKMAADEYAENYYAKSHAARQAGMQTGLTNILKQAQQFIANSNKLEMYKDIHSVYSEDGKSNSDKIKQILSKYKPS
jgi:hypothetical protein